MAIILVIFSFSLVLYFRGVIDTLVGAIFSIYLFFHRLRYLKLNRFRGLVMNFWVMVLADFILE
jgi:hypothetical protein